MFTLFILFYKDASLGLVKIKHLFSTPEVGTFQPCAQLFKVNFFFSLFKKKLTKIFAMLAYNYLKKSSL
jgi:hypothetical protein